MFFFSFLFLDSWHYYLFYFDCFLLLMLSYMFLLFWFRYCS